nr:MAG TPA: hypothetical protein [Caudoviricetes sp.]
MQTYLQNTFVEIEAVLKRFEGGFWLLAKGEA